MKWVRFKKGNCEYTAFLAEETLHAVEGDIYTGDWHKTGELFLLAEVELMAPCRPTKVVCIGLNYRDHAQEMGEALPAEPILFLKPPSAVIGAGQFILYPEWIGRMDYEAELAVVIGKRGKNIAAGDAWQHIFGYTCGNDITARHLQKKDGQWSRAKSFDTFCPLGPWIVTEIDASALDISLTVNGELKQQSSTTQLVANPAQLVAFVTRVMTLEAGDVILTGTPAGVGPLKPGDSVTVRIGSVGELTNTVIAES
ncbi:MAG: fumarylacetoacetate hydrolase family protein [Dethiobacter sp.]|jgi:2-keto-4-pentenoate hydratase/2-oxohepta-3-ene-1,7-dioic acid hydratase in catechol pathway|nr:fumarylacetoacetate hydrolase family protein [Dethiobacter sp.]MBS3901572.1 fumarylacetoacetate hydrolase family protein [Dethiobacter sp.]MBS3989406.1 fumarylacetoacetate hydrolase family protein [Dethiobacter sp.]